MELLVDKLNYWVFFILFLLGMHAMIAKTNLVKKIIGMTLFQTSIILFYISIGVKKGATIPILHHEAAHSHGHAAAHELMKTADYANPLPHVLMLTAIVVGVATLGVALAVIQNIHRHYGTIEEDELLEKLAQ